jgi:predicted small lipoprotein YifL
MAAAGIVLACAACGFKGPLYLPERNATVVTHPAPAARGAAPQSQQPAPTVKQKGKSSQGSAQPPQSPPLH